MVLEPGSSRRLGLLGCIRRYTPILVLAGGACSHGPMGPKVTIDSPLGVAFDQPQVSQGDTLSWTVTLPGPEGAVAGDSLVLTFNGVGTGTTSAPIPPNITGFAFTLVVPASVADGTLTLTVEIPAVNQTAQASIPIKDTRAPGIDSAFVRAGPSVPPINTLAQGVTLFGAGLTDTLQVWAADNHHLAWIGWNAGPPVNAQDSVAVTGTIADGSFALAIPDSLAGDGATVRVFASDADGNRFVGMLPDMSITSFNQHPVRSAPVLDTITDLAVDTKRNVIYLAQPDSGRVAILSLTSMTYQTAIPFSGRPISVDLTPGGDSLYVALDTATSLVVVQLTGSPQVVGTIPVHPNFYARGLNIIHRVRVAADGHAVLTMVSSNAPSGTYIAERLDMTTDTTLLNPNTDEDPFHVGPPPLARSGDGTIVYSPGDGGIWYNALTQVTEGGGGAWNPTEPFSVAVSNAATGLVMVGHWVSLNPGGGALGLDTLFGATIASNGIDGYAVNASCAQSDTACADTSAAIVLQYALGQAYGGGNPFFAQAGRVVNLFALPHVAESLALSANDKTLIAIGAHVLMVVDLTTTVPPSASILASRHRLLIARLPTKITRRGRAQDVSPSTADTAWNLRSLLRVRVRHR